MSQSSHPPSCRGEFDCMLAWQHTHYQMDVGTLGGALTRPRFPDLALLSRYENIIAVYDSDSAGVQPRSILSQIPHIKITSPPAHFLTDYWRSGGNLLPGLPAIFENFSHS